MRIYSWRWEWMDKITINILPSNIEPKYFLKIWVDGKTYEIRNVLKSLGFKWDGTYWTKYINPFKENVKEVINELKSELSKYANVEVYSTYFIDRTFDEGVKRMIEVCKEWKGDYDIVREQFINLLKKLGFNETIKEFEKGNLEVSHITVKTKVNSEVVIVPKYILLLNRIENFKGVFNELRKLNYRYRSILRAFEIAPTKVVR